MITKIKLPFLFILLLIVSSYNPLKLNTYQSFFFPIKNIIISETILMDNDSLSRELEFLRNKNILFLNKEKIKRISNNYDFISNLKIKRIYPSTIKIIISEKKPIAILIYGKKKSYISNTGEKITFVDVEEYKNLPLVFGNQKGFEIFYRELKEAKFPIDKIDEFYFFESNRWDVILNDKKILRFPATNYKEVLKNFKTIINDVNFSKFKVFDYRIKDQLILK